MGGHDFFHLCFGDSLPFFKGQLFVWPFFSVLAVNTGVFSKLGRHCDAGSLATGLLRTLRALRTAQFACQVEEAFGIESAFFWDILSGCSRRLVS